MKKDKAFESEHAKAYSEKGFWEKVGKYAYTAGKDLIELALKLYYSAQDPQTPAWARATIVSALGYFIFPLDAIPDITPVVGYADDFGALAAAFGTVAAHIKKEHAEAAKTKLKQWFG